MTAVLQGAAPLPSDTPASAHVFIHRQYEVVCAVAGCEHPPSDTPAEPGDLPLAEEAALRARAEASDTPADGLDAAWREVEAALPEGWSFWEMSGYSPDPGEPRRVSARVRTANVIHGDGTAPEVSARGATPAEALRNLAVALTQEPQR